MKRNSKGLSFLGFVALADMIFAVSAGLLLLNPLRLDDFDEQQDATLPDLAQLTASVQAAEREVTRAEQSIGAVERAFHAMNQDPSR